VIKISPI